MATTEQLALQVYGIVEDSLDLDMDDWMSYEEACDSIGLTVEQKSAVLEYIDSDM